MSYEQILVTDKLARSVQRAGWMTLRPFERLGELVRSKATQRGSCRPEDPIPQRPTRHEVRLGG